MPPFWDTVAAVVIGLGLAALTVGAVALTFRLAERRADRLFPQVLHDLQTQQGHQPWNMV